MKRKDGEDRLHRKASEVRGRLMRLRILIACGREPRSPRNLRLLAALEREWDRLRKA